MNPPRLEVADVFRSFGDTFLATHGDSISWGQRRVLRAIGLVSLVDGKVTFRWKDYRHQSHDRTMTLDATEFIRRFLLHVLPTGFMRIRQYGLLANRLARKRLELCRRLIGLAAPHTSEGNAVGDDQRCEGGATSLRERDAEICPACKKGRMIMMHKIEPLRMVNDGVHLGPFDSS